MLQKECGQHGVSACCVSTKYFSAATEIGIRVLLSWNQAIRELPDMYQLCNCMKACGHWSKTSWYMPIWAFGTHISIPAWNLIRQGTFEQPADCPMARAC